MVRIVIPGVPKGKGRHRFGNGHAYTPKETADYEQSVKYIYRNCGGIYFETEPLSVEITAGYAIPKNTSKRKMEKMISGDILPTKKPDADNIAKIICDSLNGVAYKDDKQIVNIRISKVYMQEPRTIVMIGRMEADGWKETI